MGKIQGEEQHHQLNVKIKRSTEIGNSFPLRSLGIVYGRVTPTFLHQPQNHVQHDLAKEIKTCVVKLLALEVSRVFYVIYINIQMNHLGSFLLLI